MVCWELKKLLFILSKCGIICLISYISRVSWWHFLEKGGATDDYLSDITFNASICNVSLGNCLTKRKKVTTLLSPMIGE